MLIHYCPVCDCEVKIPEGLMESEMVRCEDCSTRYIVSGIAEGRPTLKRTSSGGDEWDE